MVESNRQNFYILGTLSKSENGEIGIIISDANTVFDDFFGERLVVDGSHIESNEYKVYLAFKDIFYFDKVLKPSKHTDYIFNEDLSGLKNIPIIFCISNASLKTGSTISGKRFPRSANYMDSSIWTYCLDNSKTPERVDWVLKSIYDNYRNGYYSTCQAREFLNLNARLSLNSYLEGSGEDTAHAKYVVPFIFHSEYKAKQKLIDDGCSEADNFCCGYKWRFLLVDDHAEVGLSVVGGNDPKTGPSKIDVILDRLRSIDGMKIGARKFDDSKIQYSDDYNIIIEYVSNLKECKEAINKKKYDIILMDYLLGDKQYIKQPGREYSYELFECIENLGKGAIGPGKRFYFMFISAYVHAIQERLDERLISRSTKDWFIGRGACPLNTPEIFLYHLHSIMQKRVSTMLSVDSKVSEGNENILCKMFETTDNNLDTVCREKFVDLLNLISHVKTLVDNDLTQKDSVLAKSIFEKEQLPTDRAFWEHFRHLCYLMGYELKSRWPEWWEEYHLIKMELIKYDKTYTDLLKSFRDYIVYISNNSH